MNHPPAPLPSLADAHNHLHDPRLSAGLPGIISTMREAGIVRCVVNGTRESDWPEVARLAEAHSDFILPAFGLHPWHAAERSPSWLAELTGWLGRFPGASIGECGLDRSRRCQTPLSTQQEIFAAQLRLAAERSLPISIHCVRAWGALLESLGTSPLPDPGFLLHSYSGAPELVAQLAPLGAHFSFSARCLHPSRPPAGNSAPEKPGKWTAERNDRRHPDTDRLATLLRSIPTDRILVETDAPDLPPPEALTLHPLAAPDGAPLNHPANLPAIAAALALSAGIPCAEFHELTTRNFLRLFGNEESADP